MPSSKNEGYPLSDQNRQQLSFLMRLSEALFEEDRQPQYLQEHSLHTISQFMNVQLPVAEAVPGFKPDDL
jgi:hypothetical protein